METKFVDRNSMTREELEALPVSITKVVPTLAYLSDCGTDKNSTREEIVAEAQRVRNQLRRRLSGSGWRAEVKAYPHQHIYHTTCLGVKVSYIRV